MSNIVLPQVDILNNTNNSTNVLVESNSSIFRTPSNNLLQNILNGLSTEEKDSLENLNFLAIEDNSLKKINLNGNLGQTTASYENLFIEGTLELFPIHVDSLPSITINKTFNEIVNIINNGIEPIINYEYNNKNYKYRLIGSDSYMLVFFSIIDYFDSILGVTPIISVLGLVHDGSIHHQTDSFIHEINDIVITPGSSWNNATCNYTYNELLTLYNQGYKIHEAKIINSNNEAQDIVILWGNPSNANGFCFDHCYINNTESDVNSWTVRFDPDNLTIECYTNSTGKDLLWVNENDDEIGEFEIYFDPRNYSELSIEGIWSYADENGESRLYHPNVRVPLTLNNYNGEGSLCFGDIGGNWVYRTIYFYNDRVVISNGILPAYDSWEVPEVFVPTMIYGIK